MTTPDQAIGGYQGLELPRYPGNLNQDDIRTNSARSALKIILEAADIKKIWLPAYTCDAVVKAVQDLGIEYDFYKIEPTFDVDAQLRLGDNDYILIVDYYGLSDRAVARGLERFGNKNTIVDCSQAFFAPETRALGTIWSPRKFFGVPDGGLLHSTVLDIHQPDVRDEGSENRMAHLISRITTRPEQAYGKYLEAEQSIAEMPVLGMSRLTERLLESVDFQVAKQARSQNASYLHGRLKEYNKLDLSITTKTAPLCYPLLPKRKMANRSDLVTQRVFLPRYWPEVLGRVDASSFEWELVSNGLFLPCDQRYTEKDMDRLIRLFGID